MKYIPLLLALGLPCSAAVEPVQKDAVQARFVLPLGLDLSARAGWIEIVGCETTTGPSAAGKSTVCDKPITQIPLSEIRTETPLETRFLEDGTLVLQQTVSKKETVWARVSPRNGWYPHAEICSWIDAPHPCVYSVDRIPESNALQLRVSTQIQEEK